MLKQFLMGGAISICNITIHALVMAAAVRVSQAVSTRTNVLHPSWFLVVVMIAAVAKVGFDLNQHSSHSTVMPQQTG